MGSRNSEYGRPAGRDLSKLGRQDACMADMQDQSGAASAAPESAVNAGPARRGKGKIVLMVLCSAVAVFSLGGITAMSGLTFMPQWLPWTVAAAVALGTGMWGRHVWRWITGCGRLWVNYMLHAVVTTLLVCFCMYLCNQLGADDCGDRVEAEVLDVYRETRYHSRRVSRNRYVRGDPYYVYFARLRFDNGLERDVPVSNGKYRRLRPGACVDVEVRRGGLGYGVIKPDRLKIYQRHKDD